MGGPVGSFSKEGFQIKRYNWQVCVLLRYRNKYSHVA